MTKSTSSQPVRVRDWADRILAYWRISFALALILLLMGVASWSIMPKEEDPRLQERWGMITVVYPGATPDQVRRLVAEPVEDALAEIDEITELRTRIVAGFVLFNIELRPDISGETAVDQAWREIRLALETEERSFPEAVLPAELDRNQIDQEAVVYALTGGDSVLARRDTAQDAKDFFLAQNGVAAVNLVADPGEQITIELREQALVDLGISRQAVVAQLQATNLSVPGGTMRSSDRQMTVLTNASFQSIDDLRQFPLLLGSGETIPLGALAQVERTISYPRGEWMRMQGEASVGLAIIPETGIDMVSFGTGMRAAADEFRASHPGYGLEVVSFQPEYVASRLSELSTSLVMGIAIIAGILVLTMGIRLGLLVSVLVPVISLAALAVYAVGGGVLHQIAVAAFVLALGLLVDNVIVIVENVQQLMNEGHAPRAAAAQTIRQLALPLAAATGTTVAAFMPMLGSVGATADFTRTIPIIAILTLTGSFLFSILVTPALAKFVLKPQPGRQRSWIQKVGERIGGLVSARPALSLLAVFILLAVGASFAPKLAMQFFPLADRAQLVVSYELPEGTHPAATNQRAATFEQAISDLDDVTGVATFVGRGTPRFYYNVMRNPNAPHLASFIVYTRDFTANDTVREQIGELARSLAPDAIVVAKPLGQGPPVDADIELKFLAQDRGLAGASAEEALRVLRSIPGVRDARTDLGLGTANLDFTIADVNALRQGYTRADVTGALLSRTRGQRLGDYRAGDQVMPLVLRSPQGEAVTLDEIQATTIGRLREGQLVVGDVARPAISWRPSVETYLDREPVVRLLAELEPGVGYNQVLGAFAERFDEASMPAGVRLEQGGASEESAAANRAILAAMPLGAIILLVSLLAEFNSYRRVLVILAAIPFIALGIIPGLVLTGVPFGFFSLLAVLALTGIVVNNAILLVEAIDDGLAAGLNVKDAAAQAVGRRIRPVLLTTMTTIAGMLPLAITKSTLWPPFAVTMIFGLSAATIVTLVLVPTLFQLVVRQSKRQEQTASDAGADDVAAAADLADEAPAPKQHPRAAWLTWAARVVIAAVLAGGVFASVGRAEPAADKSSATGQPATLFEAVAAAGSVPEVSAVSAGVEAAKAGRDAAVRSAFLPRLRLTGDRYWHDRDLFTTGPMGLTLPGPSQAGWQAGAALQQSLFDGRAMGPAIQAASAETARQNAMRDEQLRQARLQAVGAYQQATAVQVQTDSLRALDKVLRERQREMNRLIDLGRAGRVDELRLQAAISELQDQLFRLAQQQAVLNLHLGQRMGGTEPRRVLATADLVTLVEGLPTPKVDQQMVAKRSDARALIRERERLQAEMKALDREWWPRLTAQAQYNYRDPSQYDQDQWVAAQVGLEMDVIAAGTRAPRRRALAAQRESLRQQEQAVQRGATLQLKQAQAEWQSSLHAIKIAKDLVSQAQATADAEWQRFRRGEGQMFDVLDAEDLLRQYRQRLGLAHNDAAAAWARIHLEQGRSLPET